MKQLFYDIAQGPRENIEDAAGDLFLECHTCGIAESVSIFGVLDGVGGRNHGEVASAFGLHSLLTYLVRHLSFNRSTPEQPERSPGYWSSVLVKAIQVANQAILDQVDKHPTLAGMSSTVVAGFTRKDFLFLAWAGDSRCYQWRDGHIRLLTEDHTEAQQFVVKGILTPKEAMTHPLAHTIHNYLGKPGMTPSTRVVRLKPGDLLLLCSDGLTDVLGDDELAALISIHQLDGLPLSHLPSRLVNEALAAGTGDNVTALVVEPIAPEDAQDAMSRTCQDGYVEAVTRKFTPISKEYDHESTLSA